MRRHPAIEQAAVAAYQLGWDPVRYLSAAGPERLVVDAVLERAAQLRAEELRSIVTSVGQQVAIHVAKIWG